MSNSGHGFLWFRLRVNNGRDIRICFPLSIHVFRELLDSFMDLLSLISVFVPKSPALGSGKSIRTAGELIRALIALLGSVSGDGPYDLLDIETEGVSVSINIR